MLIKRDFYRSSSGLVGGEVFGVSPMQEHPKSPWRSRWKGMNGFSLCSPRCLDIICSEQNLARDVMQN